MGRLQNICEKEGVRCQGDALETLIEASDGDLRRAITFLQSTSSIKADASVTVDDINDITGVSSKNILNFHRSYRVIIIEKV